MGVRSLWGWFIIVLLSGTMLTFVGWLYEDEIRRKQRNVLTGVREVLHGMKIHDFAYLTARSIDHIYDHLFGRAVISWRAVGVAMLFSMVSTLYVYFVFDDKPLLRLLQTHIWVPIAWICVCSLAAAIPSILVTRYCLRRIVDARSHLLVLGYLVIDVAVTYLLVGVNVVLVAIFLIPVTSAVANDASFNWRIVSILSRFEPTNAMRWIGHSPARLDGVGSDLYALAALMPALIWSCLTATALVSYFVAWNTRLLGLRLATRLLADTRAAYVLFAGVLAFLLLLFQGVIEYLKGT